MKKHTKFKEFQKINLIHYLEAGLSLQQIADIYSVSKAFVQQSLSNHFNKKIIIKDEKEETIKEENCGLCNEWTEFKKTWKTV